MPASSARKTNGVITDSVFKSIMQLIVVPIKTLKREQTSLVPPGVKPHRSAIAGGNLVPGNGELASDILRLCAKERCTYR